MKAKKIIKNLANNEVVEEVEIDLFWCEDLNTRGFDCRIGGKIKWLTYPEFLRLIADDYDAKITLDNDKCFEYETKRYKVTHIYNA